MISTAPLASSIVAVVGLLLFWANPKRKVNRAVFVSSAIVAAWLICNHLAVTHPTNGLVWLRWTYAVGALTPLSLLIVKESIIGIFRPRERAWWMGNVFWFCCTFIVVVVPFTELFIPATSTDADRVRGIGYYLYYAIVVGLYAQLLRDSLKNIGTLTGARKLELQVWLGGGCVIATVIYAMIGIGSITHDPTFRKLYPLAVLVFYAATAYAITSHRIFDARQILLVGIEKIILLGVVAGVAYSIHSFSRQFVSDGAVVLLTTMAVLVTARWLSIWLDQRFQFLPQGGGPRDTRHLPLRNAKRVRKI